MHRRFLGTLLLIVGVSLGTGIGIEEFRAGADVYMPSETMEHMEFPFELSCNYESNGLDIVFVIDTAYTDSDIIEQAETLATRLIAFAEEIDITYGLVTFSDRVVVHDMDGATPGINLTSSGDDFLAAIEALDAAEGGDLPDNNLDALHFAINDYEWEEGRSRVLVHFAEYEYCTRDYFPGNDTSCCCTDSASFWEAEIPPDFIERDVHLFAFLDDEVLGTHSDTMLTDLASHREGGIYGDEDSLESHLFGFIELYTAEMFTASLSISNETEYTWNNLTFNANVLSGLLPYHNVQSFPGIAPGEEVTLSWPFIPDTVDSDFEGCFRIDVASTTLLIEEDPGSPGEMDTTVIRDETYYVGCGTDFDCTTYGILADIDYPLPGQFTTNTNQNVEFMLYDQVGDRIDPSSITMVLDGSDTLTGDTLFVAYSEGDSAAFFFPLYMFPWADGDTIDIELIDARNINGTGLIAPASTWFVIDRTGPVVSDVYPPEDGVSNLPFPIIEFDLYDELSGINPGSIQIALDSRVYTGVSLVDGRVHFESPLSYEEGDDIRVCVIATDMPDIGSPNRTNYCWEITFADFAPYPYETAPPDGSVSSCSEQSLSFMIGDSDGILEESIEFSVRRSSTGVTMDLTTISTGVTYEYDSDFGEATVTYLPTLAFTEPETVEVCINNASDLTGSAMTAVPTCWSFRMDQSAPILDNPFPRRDTTITDAYPEIYLTMYDQYSGFDVIDGTMTINWLEFPLEDEWMHIDTVESLLVFHTEEAGFEFLGGDTVNVKVKVWDNVSLCEDNIDSLMWTFYVEGGGPRAEIVHPSVTDTITCAYPSVVFSIDDPTGIDTLTATIRINGRTVRWYHGGFSWDEEMGYLIFDRDTLWREGINTIELREIDDLLGNDLETPINYTFYLDNTPPVITYASPTGFINQPYPEIEWSAYDTLAGVSPEDIVLTIGENTYGPGSEFIHWRSDSSEMYFSSVEADLYLPELDSVCVHLVVSDIPGGGFEDECPGNTTDTTWCFDFAPGGPSADLVYPFECAISSCDDDSVVFVTHDPNGLNPESVSILAVREGPEISYLDTISYGNPQISVTDSFIVFHPEPSVTDGESLYVELVTAADMLLNPLTETEEIRGYYDLSTPQIEFRYPEPSGMVTDSGTIVSTRISDDNGIYWESLVFSVNGLHYYFGDIALAINATTGMINFNPENAGLEWTDGDTFEICLSVNDVATGCGPNVLYQCWSFHVDYESVDEIELSPMLLTLNNRPNPFNPTTEIVYHLPEATFVNLEVYDMEGHRVATLFEGQRQMGTYSESFDAGDRPAGFYFARLRTEKATKTTRMLLVK